MNAGKGVSRHIQLALVLVETEWHGMLSTQFEDFRNVAFRGYNLVGVHFFEFRFAVDTSRGDWRDAYLRKVTCLVQRHLDC